MSNLRICAKNHVDDLRCVLSCSVAPILPLSSIQNYIRGRIARIDPSAAFDIKGTYGGESVRASVAAIMRHTGSPDGTWRYRGYSDDAWTTLVQDSGSLPLIDTATLGYLDFGIAPLGSSLWDSFYGQKIARTYSDEWVANGGTYSSEIIGSWKITIDDTTNTLDFDVSRVWIAKFFEFTYNPAYGSKIAWRESSQQWETDGGTLRVDGGVPYRVMALDLQKFPEADRQQLMDVLRYAGMRKDLFVDLFPGGTGEKKRDFMMNALIQSMPDLTLADLNRHSTNIVFREA